MRTYSDFPKFMIIMIPIRNFNFHFNTGSPAATAGTPAPQIFDYDGIQLPQGPGYPVGAYASPATGGPFIVAGPSPVTLHGSQSQLFELF